MEKPEHDGSKFVGISQFKCNLYELQHCNFEHRKQKIQCPSFYKYNCTDVIYDTIGRKLACQKLLMIVL